MKATLIISALALSVLFAVAEKGHALVNYPWCSVGERRNARTTGADEDLAALAWKIPPTILDNPTSLKPNPSTQADNFFGNRLTRRMERLRNLSSAHANARR